MRSPLSTRSPKSCSELRLEATSEHLGEADEIVAAGIASRRFADELRRVAPGEVVTVVATDGSPFRGRILCVGADWMRVGEIADDTGSRRVRLLRVHDLRLDAIVRVEPGSGPNDRLPGPGLGFFGPLDEVRLERLTTDSPDSLATDLERRELTTSHQRVHLRDGHVQHARDPRTA